MSLYGMLLYATSDQDLHSLGINKNVYQIWDLQATNHVEQKK